MRRSEWVGLLFTVAVALFLVPLVVPPRVAKSPGASPSPYAVSPAPSPIRNGASPPRARTVAEETASKHARVLQDMQATEKLCRIDCTRDMSHFLKEHAALADGEKASHLRQAVKDHPHMISVSWVSGGKTIMEGKAPQGLLRAATKHMDEAKAALKQGQAYESPTFRYGGKSHFVLAQPSGKPGEGVTALVRTDVIEEVERHQRRNMRLTPYPAEGRYRVESVKPNTNQDTTVRNGEDNGNASHYAVDEIVVKFREPLTPRELLQLHKELSLSVVRHRDSIYLFRSKTHKMDELKAYFAKWNPIFMEPHYLYLTNDVKTGSDVKANVVPNDTLYNQYQWNLPEIATEKGWNVTRGEDDMIVAIVDTGVQADHPDLQGRLVEGYNVIDPSQPPDDDVGHGTHVAGIIAAQVNNNEGIAGMTWFTKIMPVKALDSTGAGTTYSVAEGILWATDHGADVINMSLGNYAEAQFLHEAIKYAYDHGVVLIAASGNDNTDRPGYPAAYPEVFAVGATDPDESLAEYSNYGDYIDVAAPGTSIASTYPGSRYAALSGTSMACPHVSALASLVRSANPGLSNEQVMALLRQTAKDLGAAGKDSQYGYGQIDVNAAVKAASTRSETDAAGTAGAANADQAPSDLTEPAQTLPDWIRQQLSRLFGGA
ncbi:S8 family peptidase [Cohnella lubricantis]|uniref:Peptidase S8 n=1 Tax=Cohnella lubricantis TaxID=2163172 RepID=A0A841TCI3_9BACL|nr:S8 family peptidase [Cohnella lubricantis]MBB6678722.1 peptidase S8 [Cohnella lubricantis]MBP2119790.1 subtilisin family serine protease [Cohnella lubricantis]